MTPIGGICRPCRQALPIFAAVLFLVALAAPANAEDASPLVDFLLKPEEMMGFTPGKPRVFRTAAAVEAASGEKPSESEVERYKAEGFVEAATVRMHSSAEPGAKGVSSVFEFETPIGARKEMRAELKEEIDPTALRQEGILDYLVLRHFKVPVVPGSVGFALLPKKATERAGLKSGVAKVLFAEGSCLSAVGVASFKSNQVIEPVTSGTQAIFDRSGGDCP